MKKIAAPLIAFMVLQACSGAQFALPHLTDAEISRAALTVPGDSSTLPKVERSETENRALVARVTDRLLAAAPPLCAHAEVDSCQFNVRFKEDDDVNAYASGEGEIVVYSGLLKHLTSEDEVAAVIGHEIGHHLAEHVEESGDNVMIGAVIGGLVMGGLLIAAGYDDDDGSAAALIEAGMGTGAVVGLLSYSKDQEREADLLSAYLLSRAGYDLKRAGNVFSVLAQMNSGHTRSGWFDTHPAGPERIAAWDKAVAEVAASPDKLPRQG